MLTAQDALRAGRLGEAVATLSTELRSNPDDAQRRTFLFELLCFAGEYDRADRQLDVLAGASQDAAMGTLLYRSALHAERTRRDMFARGALPSGGEARVVSGTLNGRSFTTLVDADPRIGPRLELYAAGAYVWLPLEHVQSVQVEPPRQLRDLLWAPAVVRTAPTFSGTELGEVLLPVLTPGASGNEDDLVRLGRVTAWDAAAGGSEAPVGLKLFLVDGEEFPILELRELIVTPPSVPATVT